MPVRHKLTKSKVENLPAGKHGDGGGLWLYKRDGGSVQWFVRCTVHGRRREMGLGGWPSVGLEEARDLAEAARRLAKSGIDPVRQRERELREAERGLHILRDVAEDAFESRKSQLKGDGKAGRWFSPLEIHVLPKLGKVPVAEIDQIDIRDCLRPIWHTKAETAKKALNRMSIVMKHAAALGLDVDVQACEKASALLGKPRHVPVHIPSMPWADVPAFYETLHDGTVTHLALRLLILTGVRSAAVRNCRLDQIDGDTWTIPAEIMKGPKGKTSDFRVPLSREAASVVREATGHERNGLLFPGQTGRAPISDMTLSQHMARRHMIERPHGFRASLRTWLAECTDTPHEIAEAMLAHATGNKVVDAYQHSDYLERRRVLLQRWADHVAERSTADKVRKLHG